MPLAVTVLPFRILDSSRQCPIWAGGFVRAMADSVSHTLQALADSGSARHRAMSIYRVRARVRELWAEYR